MVRKDMLINSVGYRGFTIGEAFTGPTHMNDQVKQTIEDVSTLIMGKDAYKLLKKAEQGLHSAVSVAKSTIVIRSIVIPVANFSSNVRIPEDPATCSDNIRPPVPEDPATCDALP